VLGNKQQKQEQAASRQEQLKAQFLQKQVGDSAGLRGQLCTAAPWAGQARLLPWYFASCCIV
jgi:hypothetical protein